MKLLDVKTFQDAGTALGGYLGTKYAVETLEKFAISASPNMAFLNANPEIGAVVGITLVAPTVGKLFSNNPLPVIGGMTWGMARGIRSVLGRIGVESPINIPF